MKIGYSFESFGAIANVYKEALYNWVKKYPEFSDAKKLGTVHSQYFWEKLGINGAVGNIQGFNAGTWIFNMKNRFNWRDKQSFDHTSDGKEMGSPIIILPSNDRDDAS